MKLQTKTVKYFTITKYLAIMFFINMFSMLCVLWGGYYCELQLGMEWVKEPRNFTIGSLITSKVFIIGSWLVIRVMVSDGNIQEEE